MIDRFSENWHVVYTMPRQERKVKDELCKEGFEVFLPMLKLVRQWSDRKKKVQVPLFPNYVFIKTLSAQRSKILGLSGIVRFLGTHGKPDVVSPNEIQLIQNILCHDPAVLNDDFKKGEEVRVIKGPFNGTKAVLCDIRGRHRIALRIESLNRAVTVDISPDCVEKVIA